MDGAKLVGLTGGIGSGKSAVAGLLAQHGAHVVDADAVAREVLGPGTAGLRAVVEEFGSEILNAAGDLDRTRMAALAFSDQRSRQRLNAIVHPLVAARTEALLSERASSDVVVYDVALLVEESIHERLDFEVILVVEADEAVRIQRLTHDRGMTEAQVRARIGAQASDEQRWAVADVVIVNNGTLAELGRAVDEIWRDRICPPN